MTSLLTSRQCELVAPVLVIVVLVDLDLVIVVQHPFAVVVTRQRYYHDHQQRYWER